MTTVFPTEYARAERAAALTRWMVETGGHVVTGRFGGCVLANCPRGQCNARVCACPPCVCDHCAGRVETALEARAAAAQVAEPAELTLWQEGEL